MSFKFATEPSDSEYSYNIVSLECSAATEQATKVCTKCKETKTLGEFGINKSSRDNHRSHCTLCDRAAHALRREKKQKTPAAIYKTEMANLRPQGLRRCKVCDGVRATQDFYGSSETPDGVSYTCKACEVARSKTKNQRTKLTNPPTATALFLEEQLRLEPQGLRRCTQCKEVRPQGLFGKQKGGRLGLKAACSSCQQLNIVKWRAENKDSTSEYNRAFRQANPDYVAALGGASRAAKLQRLPKWAGKPETQKFYALAKAKSDSANIDYHVDHIIPLRGKYVSGLHVATNLQVLPAAANMSKKNKFNPDNYVHTIPAAIGAESLALWACLAEHRTQTND